MLNLTGCLMPVSWVQNFIPWRMVGTQASLFSLVVWEGGQACCSPRSSTGRESETESGSRSLGLGEADHVCVYNALTSLFIWTSSTGPLRHHLHCKAFHDFSNFICTLPEILL